MAVSIFLSLHAARPSHVTVPDGGSSRWVPPVPKLAKRPRLRLVNGCLVTKAGVTGSRTPTPSPRRAEETFQTALDNILVGTELMGSMEPVVREGNP